MLRIRDVYPRSGFVYGQAPGEGGVPLVKLQLTHWGEKKIIIKYIPQIKKKGHRIADPDQQQKKFEFLTQKIVTKFSEIWSGMLLLERVPYRIKQLTRVLQNQIGLDTVILTRADSDLESGYNFFFEKNLELWKVSSNYCRPRFKHTLIICS